MSFNVLSAQTDILGAHFLEASAGTGKTFAIEHLYVRFIIEHNFTIEDVLVVTFTKLATQDLENRIYLNLQFISNNLLNNALLPDYVMHLKEKLNVKEIYNRLQNALNHFYKHNISTIHGFCLKILNKYHPGQILNDQKNYRMPCLINEIRSYLNQEKFQSCLTKYNLKVLSQKYANSYGFKQSLEEVLLKEILSKNFSEEESPNFTLNELQKTLRHIKEKHPDFNSENFYDILKADAWLFKGIFSKNQEIKIKFQESLKNFSEALAQGNVNLLQDAEICLFDLENLKKNKKSDELSPLWKLLQQNNIFQRISDFFHPQKLIIVMCRDIKKHLQKKHLLLTENDLLTSTEHLIKNQPEVREQIRDNFACIMIDEFQDTDVIQWNIFSMLYVSIPQGKNIFLIGDPKQSIYRFRNSDVYIYNQAKEAFQTKGKLAYLDINYRSHPSLMNTLNFFFQYSNTLMELPKVGKHIEYHPLKTPNNKNTIEPEQNSCQIIIEPTEELIFKQICLKVRLLNNKQNIPYKHMAVLFRDRKQMYSFMKTSIVPTTVHSNRKLTNSPAIEILLAILESIDSPYNEEKLYRALLTPVFFLEIPEILSNKNNYIEMFNGYGYILKNKGILSLFKEIIRNWGSNFIYNVHHTLYHDLETLCEILNNKTSIGTHYLMQLKLMKQSEYYDSTSEYTMKDSQIDALQLMTIHASKGLEYEVVFTPGLDKTYRTAYKTTEIEQSEEQSEDIRQIYVALTRAKSYLFIPITTNSYNSIQKNKPKTPISRFLQEITQKTHCSLEELSLKENAPFAFYDNATPEEDEINNKIIELIKPKSFDISNYKDPKILSFSSYKEDSQRKSYYLLIDESQKKTSSDTALLPIGAQTGTIIHKILEKLNFDIFNTIQDIDELIPYLIGFTKNSILEGYEKIIANMLVKTFNTPINFDGETFLLKDISSKKILKEEDFYLSHDGFTFSRNQYWKGSIDVFFEHHNHYYIIDWKTTYIGPLYEDYNYGNLLKSLHDNLLDKQAEIYQEACLKYLKRFQKEKLFKGTIFIFLRGCDTKNNGIITL